MTVQPGSDHGWAGSRRLLRLLRDLMKGSGSSLAFFKDPERAARATLDAQRILGVDAAILFADLLPMLEPMGLRLEYVAGEGPLFDNPVRTAADVQQLRVLPALEATPYGDVRVLILGQDPYHDDGQAHGMSFSVLPGTKIPPSLRNIFKELDADLGIPAPDNGYLMHWAEQGVLLLNAVLTVREAEPNSHKGKGWEKFTDAVIRAVAERPDPAVFVLWGAYHGMGISVLNVYQRQKRRIPSRWLQRYFQSRASRIVGALLTFHFFAAGLALFVLDLGGLRALVSALLR